MQTNYEAEQLSIYDLDSWCGRTFPEPSPVERQKEKTSGVSSRRPPELKSVVFQSLDLTPGHGNLLGEFGLSAGCLAGFLALAGIVQDGTAGVGRRLSIPYVKLRIIELMCRTEL